MQNQDMRFIVNRIQGGESMMGTHIDLTYDANTDSYNGIPLNKILEEWLKFTSPKADE